MSQTTEFSDINSLSQQVNLLKLVSEDKEGPFEVQGLRRVTISHAATAKPFYKDVKKSKIYVLGCKPFRYVETIANVFEITQESRKIVFDLRDDTGRIKATLKHEGEGPDITEYKTPDYVHAIGELSTFNGRNQLELIQIRPLVNVHELYHHILSVLYEIQTMVHLVIPDNPAHGEQRPAVDIKTAVAASNSTRVSAYDGPVAPNGMHYSGYSPQRVASLSAKQHPPPPIRMSSHARKNARESPLSTPRRSGSPSLDGTVPKYSAGGSTTAAPMERLPSESPQVATGTVPILYGTSSLGTRNVSSLTQSQCQPHVVGRNASISEIRTAILVHLSCHEGYCNDGCHLREIVDNIVAQQWTQGVVVERDQFLRAVEELIEDGYIFSTVDEQHFKCAST